MNITQLLDRLKALQEFKARITNTLKDNNEHYMTIGSHTGHFNLTEKYYESISNVIIDVLEDTTDEISRLEAKISAVNELLRE